MNETGTAPNLQPLKRPRARDWFWRPWYAKFWWSVILLSLLLGWTLPRDVLLAHEGAISFIMVSVLNPYLFIVGLGFGYFRAAWKYRYGSSIAPSGEDVWENYSDWHGLRHGNDPTDPTDSSWHWHPANPVSFHQRQRRMERMFGKH